MRNPFRRVGTAVALALVLGGCMTTGTQTIHDFGRFQEARAGETTKPQLHAIFGQPHTVGAGESASESAWHYYEIRRRISGTSFIPYAGIVIGGDNYHVTEATFYFDSQDVLLRSRRGQRDQFVNSWASVAKELTPDEHGTGVAEEMARLGLPFDPEENEQVAMWLDHIEP